MQSLSVLPTALTHQLYGVVRAAVSTVLIAFQPKMLGSVTVARCRSSRCSGSSPPASASL